MHGLQDFKEGLTSMIILTPDLARGLDLPGVSHVFNLDVPGSSKEVCIFIFYASPTLLSTVLSCAHIFLYLHSTSCIL